MKKIVVLVAICLSYIVNAQQPYYDNVDLTLTGQDLYFELQQKINIASNSYNYGDVRDTFLITEENPDNTNDVLLIYGFQDNSDCTTDRSRDKGAFGGSNCEYNREHVFSRSNANPEMGNVSNSTTGIGADPHNLRSSDQQMNNNRGSKKFASGSGNAGNVGSGNWYPGDEWKGDVARMMMYMYTRYGDRCLPSLNGTGATQGSTDMLQIYLQWNADDPVSEYEDQRNPRTEIEYGNRNPFIDNPALATVIWGGPQAEDRWGILGVTTSALDTITFYPNPASEIIYVQNSSSTIAEHYVIYSVTGKKVSEGTLLENQPSIDVSSVTSGLYLLELRSGSNSVTKKITIQ
ncbi:endonuclease [Jejudonia soesokkakensis]|uniref:Endonuclease n=1 Tax=Jejudonia soesokkakensis TaxID=1323432 RepID=A0ABW2MQ65_9FLAO